MSEKGNSRVGAIVPAAGQGLRLGAQRPKQFLQLAGRTILELTLEHLRESGEVDTAVVVVPAEEVPAVQEQAARFGSWVSRVVAGGAQRQDSVGNGLAALPEGIEVVLVHDAVRPFVTRTMIRESILTAQRLGAAICALPVHDTLKRVDAGNRVEATVDRERLWRVQTPQTFRRAVLEQAFAQAAARGFYGTDEGMLVEQIGHPVTLIPGSEFNIKITRPEDLLLAERIAAFWQDLAQEKQ